MSDKISPALKFSHGNHYHQPATGERVTVNLRVAATVRGKHKPLVHVRYFPTKPIDKNGKAMQQYREEIVAAIAPVIARIEARLDVPVFQEAA